MTTKTERKEFLLFSVKAAIFAAFFLGIIILINYSVDASNVITAKSHSQMAKLALDGNVVAMPENYNERVYQLAIIDEMETIPETVVIGSSRGMFLGSYTTGYEDIYNNCVSGACIEDYYALLGLYYQKFSELPKRVILEASPWVFYADNPEARWVESYSYRTAAEKFYAEVNGKKLEEDVDKENPYLSLPYFQYNCSVIDEKGTDAFHPKQATISKDQAEPADYPDGTIRYAEALENRSAKRLKKVQKKNSALQYEDVDKMTGLGQGEQQDFENLIKFLQDKNVEIIIYIQPFSVTQSTTIFDKNTNPAIKEVETYLRKAAKEYNIKILGGYDSRAFDLTDEMFIDYMHLDKEGTKYIWDTNSND